VFNLRVGSASGALIATINAAAAGNYNFWGLRCPEVEIVAEPDGRGLLGRDYPPGGGSWPADGWGVATRAAASNAGESPVARPRLSPVEGVPRKG
jgi:hypothetical protein